MTRDSHRLYVLTLFITLIFFSCNNLDSSKKRERMLLGDNGYQLFYNADNQKFLLLSSSPRVAELFDQYAYASFSADWIIKSDTLIFTHFIQHQFLIRKPFTGEKDTVLIHYDHEPIPPWNGTPTKYLIKQDTLFRLQYIEDPFYEDSLILYKTPFVKAEKILIELDIPFDRDTTKICKGG